MVSLIKTLNRASRAHNSTTTRNEWSPRRWIELGAVFWMAIEASMALALALATSSVLLLSIALDGGMELVVGSMVLWRLLAEQHHLSVKMIEQGERLILRITAVGLFALVSYLVKSSVLMLAMGIRPGLSWWSIGFAVTIALIQPLLWQGKRRRTRGAPERSDFTNHINALFLPWTLLIGLLLHHLLGWWWADPLAALVVVAFLIRKGWEAIRLSSRCSAKGAFCTLREMKQ